MRWEFDVNLTSQLCFRRDIRSIICKRIEQKSTAVNYSLQMCDVNNRIAFAFPESINRASLSTIYTFKAMLRLQLRLDRYGKMY